MLSFLESFITCVVMPNEQMNIVRIIRKKSKSYNLIRNLENHF